MRILVAGSMLLFLIAGVAVAGGNAEPEFEYRSNWTVHEFAASQKIPVKKLCTVLDLDLPALQGPSLSSLGIDEATAEKAVLEYRSGENKLVRSIILVGMAIVFTSLIVVAFLVGLLRHLHIFERSKSDTASRSAPSVVGTITSTGDMSDYSIAAVVATIFLHEEEVDAENRLLLTWRRSTGSAWRTGGPMPNSAYFDAKRGRT